MRFRRLSLDAFGPFTGVEFQFPSDGGDFHVLVGPNEAGKSSALRAIGDVLFGIPLHSSDNFRHAHENLMLRAEIADRAGQLLSFKRRKKNAPNDLLNDQGEVLDQAVLRRYLGAVDRERFEAMFGLSSERLQAGAEYLLSDKGALAQTLFAAGTGLASVNASIKSLRAEMEAIYKPSGKKLAINVLKKEWETHWQASSKEMLAPNDWSEVQGGLSRVEEERNNVLEVLGNARAALEWLVRCGDSLPLIGLYRVKSNELQTFADLPFVADDYGARVRTAQKSADSLDQAVKKLQKTMREIDEKQAEATSRPVVLKNAARIEQLHGRFAAYRQDVEALADADRKLRDLRGQLESKARELEIAGGLSGLAARSVPLQQQLKFREAARKYEAAQDRLRQDGEKCAKQLHDLENMTAELEGIDARDQSSLKEAVDAGRALAELPARLDKVAENRDRLFRELTTLHGQLWGAPEDWDQVCQLRIVPLATVEKFEQREQEVRSRVQTQRETTEQTQAELASLRDELTRLQRGGALPSSSELSDARAHRDRGWKAVLSEWRGIPTDEMFAADGPLEDAYPRAVERADAIADQLRKEADSVAHAEEKRQQLTRQEEKLQRVRQALEEDLQALDALTAEWQSLWTGSGVDPRSPMEMKAWRVTWTTFQERYCDWQGAENTWTQDSRRLQLATENLAVALGSPDRRDFNRLLVDGDKLLEDGLKDAGRGEQLKRQLERQKLGLAKLEKELEQASLEEAQAGKAWTDVCETLGYSKELSPSSGEQLLEEELRLLEKYEQCHQLSAEVEVLQSRCKVFREELADCAEAVGVVGGSLEVLDSELWKMLGEELKVEQRKAEWRENRESQQAELDSITVACEASERHLHDLLRVVGLTTTEGLEEVLGRIDARKRLQETLDQIQEPLLALARGENLDRFTERVLAEDADTISSRRRDFEEAIESRLKELEAFEQRRDELLARRARMEQSTDAAAESRQRAAMAEASLVEKSLEYVRLRLTAHILESQIDAFRQASQGPLLSLGGELFSRITLGGFSSLIVEPDDRGEQEVFGVREGKQTVRPKAMSSGTRDQLFLALRMAALEMHAQEHEPMPLILDDLLITFDDARSAAILREFRSLSEQTQVLLFTHHEHLVEMCRQTLDLPDSHIHHMHHGRQG